MSSWQKFFVLLPSSLIVVFFLFFVVKLNSLSAQDENANAVEIQDLNAEESINETASTSAASQQNTNKNDEKITTSVADVQLAVSESRCRGCGRCVIADPEHFELSGRIAVVISQSNLSSTKLASAIANCPADAISLN